MTVGCPTPRVSSAAAEPLATGEGLRPPLPGGGGRVGREPGKTLAAALLLVSCMLSNSCSSGDVIRRLAPEEESQFAEDCLSRLREGDFDPLRERMDPSLRGQTTDEKLGEVAGYFPDGEWRGTERTGFQSWRSGSRWEGSFSFELEFSNGWALANVVLGKQGDALSILGLNVFRTPASQREINAFTLVGKSPLQWTVLGLSTAALLFVLSTAYACVRTPMRRRKWLWILMVLVGVGSVGVNWTTGTCTVRLLTVRLLSASVVSAAPSAPWVISASLPIGALWFWIRRRGLIEGSREQLPRDA